MLNPDVVFKFALILIVVVLSSSLGVAAVVFAIDSFQSNKRREKFLYSISKLSGDERRVLLDDLEQAQRLSEVYDKIDKA